MVWNKFFSIWNGNKVICDLVQHIFAGIYARKTFCFTRSMPVVADGPHSHPSLQPSKCLYADDFKSWLCTFILLLRK